MSYEATDCVACVFGLIQLNDAKDGWEHRASELQDRHSRREDVLRRQLSAMEAEVAQARQEAAGGHERLRELQARKAQEMDHVESRIRAAIAKKDEVIERLRKDHDAVAAELRQTKDVLKRQQQALWS